MRFHNRADGPDATLKSYCRQFTLLRSTCAAHRRTNSHKKAKKAPENDKPRPEAAIGHPNARAWDARPGLDSLWAIWSVRIPSDSSWVCSRLRLVRLNIVDCRHGKWSKMVAIYTDSTSIGPARVSDHRDYFTVGVQMLQLTSREFGARSRGSE